MRIWFRRLANPIGSDDVPIGMLTSPTEARGERDGLAIAERLAAHPPIAAIGAALDRYTKDDRGSLAIRKALHLAIEARMRALALRADPPERHGFGPIPPGAGSGALDHAAARALGIRVAERRSPTPALAAAIQAGALVATTIAVWVRAGGKPGPQKLCQVGAPAFGNAQYWAPLRRALAESGHEGDGAFAVVTEAGYDVDPGPDIPRFRPAEAPVDRIRWWREAVAPSIRLAASVMARVLRDPLDPAVSIAGWFALHLTRKQLPFQRLLHSTRFRFYLDISEYSAGHIVKAALLGREGGRLVRWPHCYLDNPGATLSFLGYHLYLGTGPYEADVYGATWHSACDRRPVGFFKNDRRFASADSLVEPSVEAAVAEQRALGRRMLAYFGPSAVPGIEPVVLATVAATLDAVIGRPGWYAVIKAKGAGAVGPITAALGSLDAAKQLAAEKRLVVVPYEARGHEPCPAGWLIREMSAGVGIGSVQLEALTQGKPCFSYMPVVQETPYQRLLAGVGLGHDTPAGLAGAIARWLDDPAAFPIPYDRFRAWFDPFADDSALSRIVGLLWREDGQFSSRSAAA